MAPMRKTMVRGDRTRSVSPRSAQLRALRLAQRRGALLRAVGARFVSAPGWLARGRAYLAPKRASGF